MISRSISPRQLFWQRCALAAFAALGTAYAATSLTANGYVAYAEAHLGRPELALTALHRAAAIFPLHNTFRDSPGYFAVWAQVHREITREIALNEVTNTLQIHPNLRYFQAHYRRLKGSAT